MFEGNPCYADSATAGLNVGCHGGRTNPDYGADLPTLVDYGKTEDSKAIGIHSLDGRDIKRVYKFHKKTGVGVAVFWSKEDGLISVKFIG